MDTVSVEDKQGELDIVQTSTYEFPATPVKEDEGDDAILIVPPIPLMIFQDPVPTAGVFAAKVTEVAQTVWSGPALATVGLARNVITTSSIEAAHGAFAIVQRKV